MCFRSPRALERSIKEVDLCSISCECDVIAGVHTRNLLVNREINVSANMKIHFARLDSSGAMRHCAISGLAEEHRERTAEVAVKLTGDGV